jgi:hypothetical protein
MFSPSGTEVRVLRDSSMLSPTAATSAIDACRSAAVSVSP